MKILVVGDGHSAIHEQAVAEAFRKLGHRVEVLYWFNYFHANSAVKKYWLKVQNKLIWGWQVFKLNSDLIEMASQFTPDLVFVYRGTHITAYTISKLKAKIPGCRIFGYNNDDPFAPGHPQWLWRHFVRAIPLYDVVFAYRKHNLDDFVRCGAKRVGLLMPWFVPELHRPLKGNDNTRAPFLYDVVFIGHYEDDHRLTYIETLFENGINVKVFGPEWDRAPRRPWLVQQWSVLPVRGHDYSRTLCSSRIALSFLSKLNRDTYTRRCFEIPATRTLLLSEYSTDLTDMFKEGKEAEFFRDPDEMLKKARMYLENDQLREAVAMAGFKRVHRDGHDVVSRMRMVLNYVNDI